MPHIRQDGTGSGLLQEWPVLDGPEAHSDSHRQVHVGPALPRHRHRCRRLLLLSRRRQGLASDFAECQPSVYLLGSGAAVSRDIATASSVCVAEGAQPAEVSSPGSGKGVMTIVEADCAARVIGAAWGARSAGLLSVGAAESVAGVSVRAPTGRMPAARTLAVMR